MKIFLIVFAGALSFFGIVGLSVWLAETHPLITAVIAAVYIATLFSIGGRFIKWAEE